MKSVLVIGMGRFGRHLAGRMLDLGNDVMIVDSNEKLIEELSIRFGDSQIGDCTNENVIKSAANIPNVETALVNTINVYDILKYDSFIITTDAVKKVEEVYA